MCVFDDYVGGCISCRQRHHQRRGGTYVEDNILIDKPLKIVGAGVGAVTVTGNNRDVGSADLYQVFDIRPPASRVPRATSTVRYDGHRPAVQ